jgi:hypothetical protein
MVVVVVVVVVSALRQRCHCGFAHQWMDLLAAHFW